MQSQRKVVQKKYTNRYETKICVGNFFGFSKHSNLFCKREVFLINYSLEFWSKKKYYYFYYNQNIYFKTNLHIKFKKKCIV